MAINFPLRIAFAMSQVLVGGVFISVNFQEPFDFLSYFFYDPLIVEQCVIQPPIIFSFFAVAFVVEF
jgi:hypothetical protein